jgi:SAM-dependent methyltransferase
MRHYSDRVRDIAGQSVLIVGCSDKGVTAFAKRGADVTGIDISSASVAKLNAELENAGVSGHARALVMDAEDVDLPAASFDLICCTGVLHHLDVERSCRSWSRLLKPGGRVVMQEPMAWNPGVALYRVLTPEARTPFEHPLKPRDIAILRRFFSQVDVSAFVLTSVLAAPLALLPSHTASRAMMRLLEPLDDFLLAVCPPLKYFAWTTTIECSTPIAGTGASPRGDAPQVSRMPTVGEV